jgi:hypothetical protein
MPKLLVEVEETDRERIVVEPARSWVRDRIEKSEKQGNITAIPRGMRHHGD